MANPMDKLMEHLLKNDKEGVITTPKEFKEQQFGMPLRHYAQQYLFGATGLRLKVFHSIAGVPASCKSPLLFDLMGHICAPAEAGGLGGIGFLYELEDKISPTLLNSMMAQYGDIVDGPLRLVRDLTIEGAMKHIAKQILPAYRMNITSYDLPMVIGMDSIGGAASSDTVKKIESEGAAGKGYYDKAHFIKYFCENAGALIGDIPVVFICVNQEKEQAAAAYGPPQKKITGGMSQVFKDGHMISATYKTLASGDGKVITLRTTKTSFCDARKIEVTFRWNKFGTSQEDAYGHHFDWALASARCLADPDKGVGELRDICDVKVSDLGLVTCPQLGLKSVKPDEFEAALMSDQKVLNALYVYQKIDVIKDMAGYAEYHKSKKAAGKKPKETVEEAQPKVTVKTKKAPKKDKPEVTKKPLFSEEAEDAGPISESSIPVELAEAGLEGETATEN